MRFPPVLSRFAWLAVAAFIAVAWFTALDTRVLQHPDEGRYGELAREMAVTGDWVTPRLDGLKYFEKPPLQYWVTAAFYRLFETDEWTTRMAPAIGGMMIIVSAGVTTTALAGPLAGAFAALVASSFVLVVAMSHFASLDAFFTGWMAIALGAFLRAQQPGSARRTRGFMLLTWAMLAMATLTKGPVALVIAGGSLVVYTLATRDTSPWRRLSLLPGIILFLAITVPWFVLVSRANPEFLRFFFIHEHVERFLTTEHNRTGAPWYFVPIFGLGAMPWLFVWFGTVWPSWRDSAPQPSGFHWQRFCLAWAGFVFVFFSLSGSKLPSYILPEFPALAMLLGRELERARARMLLWLALPHAMVALGFLVFVVFFYEAMVGRIADDRTPAELFHNYHPWIVKSALVFALGSLAAAWCFSRGSERAKAAGIIAVSLSSLVGFQFAFIGHEAFNPVRSVAPLLARAENSPGGVDPAAPVYQVESYDQTLPFYLGRPTTLVGFRDEFALGIDAEPHKAFALFPPWIAEWEGLPQGYALMPHSTYDTLSAMHVPMRIVAHDTRRVFVARR